MKDKKKYSNRFMVICIIGVLVVAVALFAVFIASRDGEGTSTVEEQIKSEKAYTIETNYCDLYYPEKWESKVSTKVKSEGEISTVQFYGNVGTNNKQHLFDIIFGGEEGVLVGHYETDGELIPVYVNNIELETKGWSDEEILTASSMKEDINYVLGMLQKEKGFISE